MSKQNLFAENTIHKLPFDGVARTAHPCKPGGQVTLLHNSGVYRAGASDCRF